MDDAAALFPRIAAAPVPLHSAPPYLFPAEGRMPVQAEDGRTLYRLAAPLPPDRRVARYPGQKGSEWSRSYLRRYPLCARCWARHGRIKGSRCVDHIVDLEFGGDHNECNLQPLCRECNEDKRLETRGLDNVHRIRAEHAELWDREGPRKTHRRPAQVAAEQKPAALVAEQRPVGGVSRFKSGECSESATQLPNLESIGTLHAAGD